MLSFLVAYTESKYFCGLWSKLQFNLIWNKITSVFFFITLSLLKIVTILMRSNLVSILFSLDSAIQRAWTYKEPICVFIWSNQRIMVLPLLFPFIQPIISSVSKLSKGNKIHFIHVLKKLFWLFNYSRIETYLVLLFREVVLYSSFQCIQSFDICCFYFKCIKTYGGY